MAKAKPQEFSLNTQPGLFKAEDMPEAPGLVEAAKNYLHTGTTAGKDEERAEFIVSTYLTTGSLLATSRRCACSPLTVKALLALWEERGKLVDLKQRLANKLGIVAELASDMCAEMLQAGVVPPNVVPIMMGVAVDKKAQLDGEPTARIEVTAAAPLAAGDVLAYLQGKGIPAPAIDVESIVRAQKPQEIEGKP